MLQRIIRIAVPVAAALALLLEGGCVRTDVLDPAEGTPITFNAGSPLLRDDATTKALKTTFANDESISVFGRRHSESVNYDVFESVNGETVTKDHQGPGWHYTDIKSWNWRHNDDYYDFIGIYPSGISTQNQAPANLVINTPYTLTGIPTNNPDLLYAAQRRSYGDQHRLSVVQLGFLHALCAVSIIVRNQSENASITITSFRFEHVITSAVAQVSLDEYGDPVLLWTNIERHASAPWAVPWTDGLASYPENFPITLPGGGIHAYTGDFYLMIPGRLDVASDGSGSEAKMPKLILNYNVGNTSKSPEIPLRSICEKVHGTPITSWDPGVKYTYEIDLRVDGGVLVNVITTQWQNVSGQTPGLLID